MSFLLPAVLLLILVQVLLVLLYLYCFDYAGNVLWLKPLRTYYRDSTIGHQCSPNL